MRTRLIAALLVLGLFTAGTADAKPRHRVAYFTTIGLVGTLALGSIATSIALRFAAPGANTLQTYKRMGEASDDLAITGAVLGVPLAIFSLLGGLTFDLKPEDKAPHAALYLRSTGPGLAFGGTF